MRVYVKSILTAGAIAFLALVFCVGAVAPHASRRVVAAPVVKETRHFVESAAAALRLRNADGAVRVYTQDRGTLDIEATVTAYALERGEQAEADASRHAGRLVVFERTGDALEIVTEPVQRPDGVDVRVDYIIIAPFGTNLDIQSANGNVWISRGCGAVTVQGRNTDIEIVEPRGPVTARSTNGRIKVLDAEKGAALETVNGNVYAHIRRGSIDAETTNGMINAALLEPDIERCSLRTQNGGIVLRVTDKLSAALEARTARGRIRAMIPLDTSKGIERRNHVRGVIGDGHADLHMDTLNGNILIARSEL